MGKIIYCEQGTDEWRALRTGKFTASRVVDLLMAKTTAGYQNYIHEVACEILTGEPQETPFSSSAMEHGKEKEEAARVEYAFRTGHLVTVPGIIIHDQFEYLAASPDGCIEPTHGLEIKCPMTKKHVETYLGGKIDRAYIIQMHVCMMCYGVDRWDFVSFDDRLPEKSMYFCKTFEKDPAMENQIIVAVMSAWAEVQSLVNKLK